METIVKENFRGNINLKKPGIQIPFTGEQVLEYERCRNDPIYFANKYVKIIHVDRGLINLTLFKYQEEIIRTSVENRFVITKLPRQAGKTTAIAALMLWYVLFHSHYSIAIVANKAELAQEILSRIQLAYEWIPMWMQQGVQQGGWNKRSIELENGSKIIAAATTGDNIRGRAQNLVYLDEFAFVEQNLAEAFFASVFPTISSGVTTKLLITSTPNGLNMFYKIWKESQEGRNDYKRIEINWWDTPGRDENWKKEMVRATSADQFQVEFECQFLGSKHTLISGKVLATLTHSSPIEQRPGFNIYEQPVKGSKGDKDSIASQDRLYCIIVDTSRGKGLDYSAFSVIDVSDIPYRQVATYRDNDISALLYPNIIFETAKFYNEALVLVETNDVGQQVVDILFGELEYENIVYCMNDRKHGQVVTGTYAGSHMGVRTTKSVKRIGCANAKTLIEGYKLIIPDYQTIYELSRFALDETGSFEAEEGNDDLVMTLVLFGWATAQPYFKELTSSDFRARLHKERQHAMETDMLPFSVVIETGQPEPGMDPRDELMMSNLKEGVSFDSWLTS